MWGARLGIPGAPRHPCEAWMWHPCAGDQREIFVTLAKLSGRDFFGHKGWLISDHPDSPRRSKADERYFK
jgi:hypothetical protein